MIRIVFILIVFQAVMYLSGVAQPFVNTTNPENNSTISIRATTVSVRFNENIGLSDNSAINNDNVDNLVAIERASVSLPLTDPSMDDVTFNGTANRIDINFNFLTPNANYSITIAPVENNMDEASEEFTLNFSTGDIVTMTAITAQGSLCPGSDVPLNAITIDEGFAGNFFNPGNQGAYQNIEISLPASAGLTFDASSANIARTAPTMAQASACAS